MGDFGQFVSAIFEHWVVLMSGLVSVAISIRERLKNRSISSTIFWTVAVLCVFFACFKAWRDEHHSLVSLRESMDVIARIRNVVVGGSGDSTLLTFVVEIRNKGKIATIADNWTLKVIFPQENTEHKAADNFVPSGHIHFSGATGVWDFSSEDDLRVKGSSSPIPAGGKLIGVVSFVLINVRHTAVPIGTTFNVSFTDVRGTNHVCDGFTKYRPEDAIPLGGVIPGLKP